MDTETRAFLEQLEERLASKADISALEERLTRINETLEERLVRRIDDSQEALAVMVKHHVEQTQAHADEARKRLDAIGEALDANAWSSGMAVSETQTLQTYRSDIDRLASRVKALEEHANGRR